MRRTQIAFVAALLSAACLQRAEAVVARGTPITGYATFYGGPQDGLSPTTPSGGLVNGACGYGQLSQQDWPNWNVVSIGPNNPVAYKGNKKGCGYCIQATCTSGCGTNAKPVTLLVTDECPSCAPNQLNLNALSFQNSINNDLSVGVANITFEQVDCTPPGNILAKVVKSRPTEGGYIGFALLAVAGEGTITGVEIKGQGADWQPMANLYGDVWEASNFGAAPLSIRTHDNFGLTLTAPNVITAVADGTYATNIQYPLSSQAGAPAASVPGASPSTAPLAASRAPTPAPTGANSAAFGPGFLATPAGTFCDARCFSQGLTASQFKKIGTQLSTFACGVAEGATAVSGYQLSNGTATCSVASPTGVQDATDYSCLCQTQAQTQGLQPYNGTACSAACDISIDGLTGSSVPADAAGDSFVCLPLAETSQLNRFGSTVQTASGAACAYDQAGQSVPAQQFSCFCLFTAPPATAAARRMLL